MKGRLGSPSADWYILFDADPGRVGVSPGVDVDSGPCVSDNGVAGGEVRSTESLVDTISCAGPKTSLLAPSTEEIGRAHV